MTTTYEELRILEGAEKLLRRRGYNWLNFGMHKIEAPHGICIGGAICLAMNCNDINRQHPVFTRVYKQLKSPRAMRGHDASAEDISEATITTDADNAIAALREAITECRSEIHEKELTAV